MTSQTIRQTPWFSSQKWFTDIHFDKKNLQRVSKTHLAYQVNVILTLCNPTWPLLGSHTTWTWLERYHPFFTFHHIPRSLTLSLKLWSLSDRRSSYPFTPPAMSNTIILSSTFPSYPTFSSQTPFHISFLTSFFPTLRPFGWTTSTERVSEALKQLKTSSATF